MDPIAQELLTFAIIAAAAAVVLRRVLQTLRGAKSGCGGGCTGCAASPEQPQGWVSIEALTGVDGD